MSLNNKNFSDLLCMTEDVLKSAVSNISEIFSLEHPAFRKHLRSQLIEASKEFNVVPYGIKETDKKFPTFFTGHDPSGYEDGSEHVESIIPIENNNSIAFFEPLLRLLT